MDNEMFGSIFKEKKVLVTGHTGFKGSWLSIWLNELGANVIGYALDPYTNKDNFVLSNLDKCIIDNREDIRNFNKLLKVFNQYKPEIIFHLAAQSLVQLSYEKPKETYEININGTVNVLEAARLTNSVKVIIIVTSDKCYENQEWVWGYREIDIMGGYDPYSSSKGCVEIITSAFKRSFFNLNKSGQNVAIASVRAGNVIGGGDWSRNRLVPDCIKSIESRRPIKIRNPKSIRPWQHVLEPLSGYLLLAEKMLNDWKEYSSGWNFGPNIDSNIKVWDLVKKIVDLYGRGEIIDCSNNKKSYEARILSLDISKALFKLGWRPTLDINETLEMSVDWYKRYKDEDVYNLCVEQIKKFMDKWKLNEIY
jgi:CDP-glucose 4,6-dehydratase